MPPDRSVVAEGEVNGGHDSLKNEMLDQGGDLAETLGALNRSLASRRQI